MAKKGKRPVGGRFIIIILILVLLLFGFLVGPIRALTNEILLGGLVNLCAVFIIMTIFFFFTLWLAGTHVLPVDRRNKAEKANARRMLQRYALGGNVAMAVVREGAALPGPHGENREHVSGVGVIDADSVSIFTLFEPQRLSRIRGTGLVFTRDQEYLDQIIDLRIQLRTQEFPYVTRDGIPVKARLTMRLQIDQTIFNKNLHAHDPKDPYPAPINWSIHAAQRALSNLQSVDSSGTVSRWSDVPLFIANGALRAIVSEYTFDQLTKPQDPEANPRGDIRADLDKRVRPLLLRSGIKLLVLSVGLFLPGDLDMNLAFDPEKPKLGAITEQRISAWKAEWESRMIKISAEGQAEAERQREKARVQARMELIMRITQALEHGVPADSSQEQIAQRFINTLWEMAKEPDTRARLEEDSVQLLLRLTGPSEAPSLSEQSDLYGISPES